MEWITAIAQLLGSVAWPVTVLILVLIFRKQIADRLDQPFSKLKIPGGEIEFDVKKLEDVVKSDAPASHPSPGDDPAMFLATGDLQLSMARLRVAIENDLFRIAQRLGKSDTSKPATVNQRLDELVIIEAIPATLAENVKAFMDIANRVIHGAQLPDDVKGRATIVGANLAAQVDHQRKVIELQYDFAAHLLWHMHWHVEDNAKKYYWWSAIAATCPEFDYNYDVYCEAAKRHNKRLVDSMVEERASEEMVGVVSLSDFVQILEFRESELNRLAAVWKQDQMAFSKANAWQWPSKWGNIGWGGPVVGGLSYNEVERQLMQTRSALARYRARIVDG